MVKNGVTLLIDPMSYQYLVGAEIDYTEGLEGAQFVIKNPNATTHLRLRVELLGLVANKQVLGSRSEPSSIRNGPATARFRLVFRLPFLTVPRRRRGRFRFGPGADTALRSGDAGVPPARSRRHSRTAVAGRRPISSKVVGVSRMPGNMHQPCQAWIRRINSNLHADPAPCVPNGVQPLAEIARSVGCDPRRGCLPAYALVSADRRPRALGVPRPPSPRAGFRAGPRSSRARAMRRQAPPRDRPPPQWHPLP